MSERYPRHTLSFTIDGHRVVPYLVTPDEHRELYLDVMIVVRRGRRDDDMGLRGCTLTMEAYTVSGFLHPVQ